MLLGRDVFPLLMSPKPGLGWDHLPEPLPALAACGGPGIGVQLALWEFINQHDDVAADQALAAYDAVARLVGRDFAMEAEAI